MIAYKFLAPGAVAPFTGFRWPAGGAAGPGPWVAAPRERPELRIHACKPCDLAYWLEAELWRAELADPVDEARRQVRASRGRIRHRRARTPLWCRHGVASAFKTPPSH